MAIWIIRLLFKERSTGTGEGCVQGEKMFKKKRIRKIAGLIFPISTDRFSFPRHRSRFSDSAVATAIASQSPFQTPLPVFQVDTKQTLICYFHIYIFRVPLLLLLSPNCSQKKYWTSFSLNKSVLHTKNGYRSLTEPFIRGPSKKLRMPLNHKEAKCRTRTLPGENTGFLSPFFLSFFFLSPSFSFFFLDSENVF